MPAKKKQATKEDVLESPPPRPPGELPGMEGDGVAKPNIEALNEACEKYKNFRDARMTEGREEVKAKKLVMALMESKSLGSYEHGNDVFVLAPKDETKTLKVKHKADYTGDPSQAGD